MSSRSRSTTTTRAGRRSPSSHARRSRPASATRSLPWLVFLQGGPGGRAPRPTQRNGWLGRALQDHRVLLLDQRGTGRSTPATRQTLAAVGSPAEQARYLTHFRADAIVRDAEAFRRELVGDEPWTVLGQSFGGFCTLTYLSYAPEGVRTAVVTGGLAPLDRPADDVYRATYERVDGRTSRFLERYPDDGDLLDSIADHLAANDVRLSSGDPFTVERLQSLGIQLGASDGFEKVHYLLETAWAGSELADEFLAAVESTTSFVTQPLYALLHEAMLLRRARRPSGRRNGCARSCPRWHRTRDPCGSPAR